VCPDRAAKEQRQGDMRARLYEPGGRATLGRSVETTDDPAAAAAASVCWTGGDGAHSTACALLLQRGVRIRYGEACVSVTATRELSMSVAMSVTLVVTIRNSCVGREAPHRH
jgi:hypothetical protein